MAVHILDKGSAYFVVHGGNKK